MTAIRLVFGNEKGGSGKSTTAIQVAIGLLRLGYRVATFDLDARQGTMTRFFSNRFLTARDYHAPLPSPLHFPLEAQDGVTVKEREIRERDFFLQAIQETTHHVDFIIMDTAGAHTFLGQLAHGSADVIITPLNDSVVDLDVIARPAYNGSTEVTAAVYTKMVHQYKHDAQAQRGNTPRWIVLRNRLLPNQDHIGNNLKLLAGKFDFELIHGLHDHVKLRELFSQGLSVMDPLRDTGVAELSARQDVRQLLRALDPVRYKGYRNAER
jgi:chromosome partitioning protein